MPKSFSEQEKNNIRNKLIESCRTSWILYGFKKTSIDELCKSSGISKGAFYIFYESKEVLFYETIKIVQQNLYDLVEKTLLKEQNKYGFANALKVIYAEYDRSPFLYNTSSEDFISFIHKLSDDKRQAIISESYTASKNMLNKSYLTLIISEEKALSVLSSLLNMIEHKDKMLSDHYVVFDFMIDNLIDKIFK